MADIVTLNVGGVIYTTARATLTRYPKSMLGAMFSGKHQVTTDDQGRCFIDRDGSLFRYVLNFMRCSELALPEDFKELDMLGKEATFYQIEPLVDAIEKARHERGPKQRKTETLEMKQISSDEWILRGSKSTIDKIYGYSRKDTDDDNVDDFWWGNMPIYDPEYAQFDMDGITACRRDIVGATVSLGDFKKDAELVTRLHSIIVDLGFTLKSSTPHNGLEWRLFERC